LGEGVFFKKIPFPSERKTNVKFPIAPGKIQGWIKYLMLILVHISLSAAAIPVQIGLKLAIRECV